MLSNIVSVIALLVATVSLGFTRYQYHRSQTTNRLQKVNEILEFSYRLRNKSQNLRDFIGKTDYLEEQDRILDAFDLIAEEMVSKTLLNPKVKNTDVYKLEEKLLGIDLLEKQIKEQARFNQKIADFEASN